MSQFQRIAGLTVALWLALISQLSAQSLLERLEKRLQDAGAVEPAPPVAERGQPADNNPPGYLGLTADDKEGGIEVIAVRAGGPAEAAGLRLGDRITSIGGVEVSSLAEMGELVDKLPAGSRIDMVLDRRGREVKVALTLGAREGAAVEELPGPGADELFPEERPLEQRATLGVRALPISAELQRRYGLTARRGAVIVNIQEGSPAARYGLSLGAAIVAVDGVRIDSPDDLAGVIGNARPGDNVEISFYLRDQVFRKKVRLGPSELAAPEPREGRPLLRRLERAIEGEFVPGENPDAVRALQGQVAALQEKIDMLEARIAALEGRDRPAEKETPAAEDEKLPDLKPPLKPLEP